MGKIFENVLGIFFYLDRQKIPSKKIKILRIFAPDISGWPVKDLQPVFSVCFLSPNLGSGKWQQHHRRSKA